MIPYRIRLWWAKRQMPTCSCLHPGLAPFLHEEGCPVKADHYYEIIDLDGGDVLGVFESKEDAEEMLYAYLMHNASLYERLSEDLVVRKMGMAS